MKPSTLLSTLLLACFLLSCGAKNVVKKRPDSLTAGMRKITKGITKYQKGCYQDALEDFFSAHELFAAADYREGVAISLNNIGNSYRRLGDYKGAVSFFEASLQIYNDIGDYQGAVKVLSNKAAALIADDMLDEATATLDTAEDSAKKHSFLHVPLLNTEGILHIKKKAYEKAEAILQKALAAVDAENYAQSATVNYTMGNLMLETHRYEQAVSFFETALEADRLSGFSKGIADDLAAMGSAFLRQKKYRQAADAFKRSIKIYALLQNRKKVEHIMTQLKSISDEAGTDLSLTRYFVNRWLEGKSLVKPCR